MMIALPLGSEAEAATGAACRRRAWPRDSAATLLRALPARGPRGACEPCNIALPSPWPPPHDVGSGLAERPAVAHPPNATAQRGTKKHRLVADDDGGAGGAIQWRIHWRASSAILRM